MTNDNDNNFKWKQFWYDNSLFNKYKKIVRMNMVNWDREKQFDEWDVYRWKILVWLKKINMAKVW